MSEEINAAQVTEEDVREALRGVLDPELHLDVVALGLIRSVDVDNTPVLVKMLLTTPFCPYGPWLVQQVKETSERASGRESRSKCCRSSGILNDGRPDAVRILLICEPDA
ncbi:MAG: metal-sulfur cluster assembly factor [Anaerolineales bacterium]|nr:metal-sulfur cluster assembly factor [Anaerolineales bacterium]